MWNILDHDKPLGNRRLEVCREPAERPQFSLAGMMKFIAGICVLLALFLQIDAEVHPMVVGLGVLTITVSTLVAVRIVDAAAYSEIRDHHGSREL